MSGFDKDLSAALNADDQAFLNDLENGRGLFEQLGSTFQGPMRFWTYMAFIFTFAFFAFAIYCGWQAFNAVDVRDTVLWATGLVIFFIAVGFFKMWMFDRMNMLSLLGEMKRIELRVAQLAERD